MTDIIIESDSDEVNAKEGLSTGAKAGLIVGAVALLAAFIAVIIFLINSPKTPVIRDIFVIFLGFELILIGIATVLLIVQIARLANMFQHEIKPVLDAANETMSTIRGTAVFVGDAMVQPVIKLNSYFASLKRFMELLNINFGK